MTALETLLDENDVVAAVCEHLQQDGWIVTQRCHTSEHGTDLVARHPASGRTCLVEAKGATSARPGTKRYGKQFTPAQVSVHVSRAILTALSLRAAHPDARTHDVLVAVPDDPTHRGHLEPIAPLLRMVAVGGLFVALDGSVSAL
jgi:hypothetical protein